MLKVLAALLLLILCFVAGVYFERISESETGELKSQITILEDQVEVLVSRNDELKETLNLVKRQIQADRIAYQLMQESMESANQQREELRSQLERQREFLREMQEDSQSSGDFRP